MKVNKKICIYFFIIMCFTYNCFAYYGNMVDVAICLEKVSSKYGSNYSHEGSHFKSSKYTGPVTSIFLDAINQKVQVIVVSSALLEIMLRVKNQKFDQKAQKIDKDRRKWVRKFLKNIGKKWRVYSSEGEYFGIFVRAKESEEIDLEKIGLNPNLNEIKTEEAFYTIFSEPKGESGIIADTILKNIFIGNLPRLVYMIGHGSYSDRLKDLQRHKITEKLVEGISIAQLTHKQNFELLSRMNNLNCLFFYYNSCFSGGLNLHLMDKIVKKINIYRLEKTDMHFPIAVGGIADVPQRQYGSRSINLKKFFEYLRIFFGERAKNQLGEKQLKMTSKDIYWMEKPLRNIVKQVCGSSSRGIPLENIPSILLPGVAGAIKTIEVDANVLFLTYPSLIVHELKGVRIKGKRLSEFEGLPGFEKFEKKEFPKKVDFGWFEDEALRDGAEAPPSSFAHIELRRTGQDDREEEEFSGEEDLEEQGEQFDSKVSGMPIPGKMVSSEELEGEDDREDEEFALQRVFGEAREEVESEDEVESEEEEELEMGAIFPRRKRFYYRSGQQEWKRRMLLKRKILRVQEKIEGAEDLSEGDPLNKKLLRKLEKKLSKLFFQLETLKRQEQSRREHAKRSLQRIRRKIAMKKEQESQKVAKPELKKEEKKVRGIGQEREKIETVKRILEKEMAQIKKKIRKAERMPKERQPMEMVSRASLIKARKKRYQETFIELENLKRHQKELAKKLIELKKKEQRAIAREKRLRLRKIKQKKLPRKRIEKFVEEKTRQEKLLEEKIKPRREAKKIEPEKLEIERLPIELWGKEAALLYPMILRVPLKYSAWGWGNNAKVVSMIPGKAHHYLEKVEAENMRPDEFIKQFLFVYVLEQKKIFAPTPKLFFIKELVGSKNYSNSGILHLQEPRQDTGSKQLEIKNFFIFKPHYEEKLIEIKALELVRGCFQVLGSGGEYSWISFTYDVLKKEVLFKKSTESNAVRNIKRFMLFTRPLPSVLSAVSGGIESLRLFTLLVEKAMGIEDIEKRFFDRIYKIGFDDWFESVKKKPDYVYEITKKIWERVGNYVAQDEKEPGNLKKRINQTENSLLVMAIRYRYFKKTGELLDNVSFDGIKIEKQKIICKNIQDEAFLNKALWAISGQFIYDDDLDIDMSGNNLTQIPDALLFCPNYQHGTINLSLSRNELQDLPREIGDFTQLKNFAISQNHLEELPQQIVELAELENLNVSDNKLKNLPEQMGRLKKLKRLYVQNNQLKELPVGVGNIDNLEALDISDNLITELPENMGKLQNLKMFFAKRNKLESLPPAIGNLHELRSLVLSGNTLKDLSKEIGNLRKLQILDVSNNELESLPQEIAQLDKLEELNIANNKDIERLPASIKDLQNLEKINVTGLNLNVASKEILKAMQKISPTLKVIE